MIVMHLVSQIIIYSCDIHNTTERKRTLQNQIQMPFSTEDCH